MRTMNPAILRLGEDYPDLTGCLDSVDAAYRLLTLAFAAGNKLMICGNGGSAADADHIAGELAKGFLLKRPLPPEQRDQLVGAFGESGRELAEGLQGGLPALALTAHTALATAIANDVSPRLVFAQQVQAFARPGDVLLGLSTSGRSANVLQALRLARFRGIRTVGLTGRDGGDMRPYCDVLICVPYVETPRIQERHLPIYHALCIAIEAHFFGEGDRAGSLLPAPK